MRLVGLDPGGTTGCFSVEWTKGQELKIVEAIEIGPEEHHIQLWRWLCRQDPDVVVCERFTYQRRDLDKGVSLEIISREYIGVAKLYCQKYNIPLAMQMPSAAKGFWPDDKLKRVGLYKAGSKHVRDAIRHVLYYTTMEQKDDFYIYKLKG